MNTQGADILNRDANLLWHPYSTLKDGAVYQVIGADGVRLSLKDDEGEYRVIDGMGSWWSAVHGYRNPRLNAAAASQLNDFSHVMFGGLAHAPAVELAERLIDLAPGDLCHVFLADSGSISIEVALKLALQCQWERGEGGRQRFAALRGGYHGDTFGTMRVCDPVDGMHSQFAGQGSENVFLPRPPAATLGADGQLRADDDAFAAWEAEARSTISSHARELAAIICEPVLQGAGGMYVYDPRALTVLRSLADEHGLLLIFDEIATGFGRTGRFFASHWADVTPDVMCVGKALTGGYMTLAAMLCTTEVARVLDESGSPLMHGPTFMGNPLACAVACASLELLTEEDPDAPGQPKWRGQVQRLQEGLARGFAPAAEFSGVEEVRALGGIGVIEVREPVRVAEVTKAAVEAGAWVRPFRKLVYVMPPYVSTEEDIAQLTTALVTAVGDVHGR